MLGRALVTPLCGLAYAAVCFAALAGKEQEIPDWLTVLPPVTLKFAGVINPFFYIYGNPQLFSAVKKLLGLRYDADLLGEGEQQEKADLKSTGVDPVDWLS